MTFDEIKDAHPAKPYLDHGFVALTGLFGNDVSIEEFARMSYGDGTRSINDTRNLLRYLMRHGHASPFEAVIAKFHVKIPIQVARQLMRHRTFSFNEMSGRYSVMSTGSYIPPKSRMNPQSTTNKQGSEEVELPNSLGLQSRFVDAAAYTEAKYYKLLNDNVSREVARGILTLNTYTEIAFVADIKNLFHFLRLRLDSHAQLEIRLLAEAIYALLEESGKLQITLEAFNDYALHGQSLSRIESEILKEVLHSNPDTVQALCEAVEANQGLSNREKTEFYAKLAVESKS